MATGSYQTPIYSRSQSNDNAGAMSEEKAAAKIQASFKGYKVRKSLKNNGALPEKKDVIANNPGKYSAPYHTVKRSKDWYHSKIIEFLSWSGNSPDLNPIKNSWYRLKTPV
ncbi:hypothetical protein TNCV_603411 [Trichonephila clavipes]|nr:hypothetical protein TNCV_603411 [Trichonephila clavipes]